MKQIDCPMTYEHVLRYMEAAGLKNTDRADALILSKIAEQAYAEGIDYGIRQLKKELLRTMYQLRANDTAQQSYEADSMDEDDRMTEAVETALEGFPEDILSERLDVLMSGVLDYGQAEYRTGYFSGIADLILQTF
ncbi:MAG: hypothetical protein E7190_03385 [Erysipelotrichaceae bacterium]|nr:hypothetical protein [Erysipelotrichaceae bacterium]